MAFTDTKAREAMAFQNNLEYEKRLERERKAGEAETTAETKKWMKENGLKTNEDCRKFVMSEILERWNTLPRFKGNKITKPKKTCANCGGYVLRQRDMNNNQEVVWLDEYQCVECKSVQTFREIKEKNQEATK